MARIGNRGEMEAFVRSVELASLSAAARELKLTPSTLSKLVTRLERALKVRLVTRSSRRILPTPEGELFLARCRRILAELEDAEMEVSGSRERPRGRLRMHAGPEFGMGPHARGRSEAPVPARGELASAAVAVLIDFLFETFGQEQAVERMSRETAVKRRYKA